MDKEQKIKRNAKDICCLPKTAIIGASGFLGKAFLTNYRKIYPDCIGTVRSFKKYRGPNDLYFDLLKPNIRPLKLYEREHRHALIFASISKLIECERRKIHSRKINVEGTIELIRQLHREGIRPIFTSSDMVFNGCKGNYLDGEETSPINEYGRQKAEVEMRIREICADDFLIIRLSKTFSLDKGDGTLLDEMAGKLADGQSIREAFDLIFCPILISDILKTVSILQSKNITGVINVCGSEAWSRYDIAAALAKAMSIPTDKVSKVRIEDIDLGCRRPKNISMNNKLMLRETKYPVNSLAISIRDVANNWIDGKK